jgi:hypothetical protein
LLGLDRSAVLQQSSADVTKLQAGVHVLLHVLLLLLPR